MSLELLQEMFAGQILEIQEAFKFYLLNAVVVLLLLLNIYQFYWKSPECSVSLVRRFVSCFNVVYQSTMEQIIDDKSREYQEGSKKMRAIHLAELARQSRIYEQNVQEYQELLEQAKYDYRMKKEEAVRLCGVRHNIVIHWKEEEIKRLKATRPKTYILNDKKVSCENCSTMRAEIEELKEGRGDWIDLTSVKLEAQQEHSKSMGKVAVLENEVSRLREASCLNDPEEIKKLRNNLQATYNNLRKSEKVAKVLEREKASLKEENERLQKIQDGLQREKEKESDKQKIQDGLQSEKVKEKDMQIQGLQSAKGDLTVKLNQAGQQLSQAAKDWKEKCESYEALRGHAQGVEATLRDLQEQARKQEEEKSNAMAIDDHVCDHSECAKKFWKMEAALYDKRLGHKIEDKKTIKLLQEKIDKHKEETAKEVAAARDGAQEHYRILDPYKHKFNETVRRLKITKDEVIKFRVASTTDLDLRRKAEESLQKGEEECKIAKARIVELEAELERLGPELFNSREACSQAKTDAASLEGQVESLQKAVQTLREAGLRQLEAQGTDDAPISAKRRDRGDDIEEGEQKRPRGLESE